MILIELQAAIDTAGTIKTFYVGDDAFVTRPTDTPADTYFDGRLQDPGSLGVHAYSDSATTGGGAGLEAGEIVLVNVDGALDDWANYGFDGRSVVIRYSATGEGAYPGSFTTLFNGTVESIDVTWKTLVIKLRDKQYMLELPALTNKYLGNNALPNGVEGTAADLKDRVKPKVFGKVFEISPLQVNTSKLTYQVNDGAITAINAVYDRGTLLTAGTNYATNALLNAASISAGTYGTCLAEGLFRLGASPAGTVTADVTQGAAAANRTVAQVLKQIATAGGLSAGEISAADVTALDAFNAAEVGVLVDGDSTTFREAMDQVANSLSVWYGFDMAGVLRMGILTEPSGTPVLYLGESDFKDDIERRAARDNAIPVYTVTVNHTKVWTPQTDLAGNVSADRKAYLALEYRKAVKENLAIQTKHKLATKLVIDTLLTTAAAAEAEATRQLALYSVNHSVFEVSISAEVVQGTALKFMDIVQLQTSRFGLSSGKMFRLIGIRYALATNEIILSLWG